MTDSISSDDPFSEAVKNLVAVSNINQILGDGTNQSITWEALKESWNYLEHDKYMNDNGRYRERRFCKARYYDPDNSLWIKEHDYYYQPSTDNPLNGGVERWFARVSDKTFCNGIVNKLLKLIGKRLSDLTGQAVWDINFYQNRIIAEGGNIGKPSPEGIHSDGVKYTVLLLMNRENIIGGENVIYDLQKRPIFSHTLTHAGDCILFSEHATYHYASPINQVDTSVTGNRDILVVEFY